jgi:flagellar hook assembly protein FlgD
VPNPFSTSTTLWYRLSGAVSVRLEIFDVAGRQVRSAESRAGGAGVHSFNWDGCGLGGRVVPGVYFARLTAAGKSWTRTLVWIK